MKEKISIRGATDFMEFFNSLDKTSDRYKEINDALDLLKKDYAQKLESEFHKDHNNFKTYKNNDVKPIAILKNQTVILQIITFDI